MAKDFVFTEEIIDGVISVLKGAGTDHYGGLPENWFFDGEDDNEVPLQKLEHGDLSDYDTLNSLDSYLPAIFVRSLGPLPTGQGGIGGVRETQETIRIIHIRRYDQCRDDDGNQSKNLTRSRSRYAKLIGKALFNDDNLRLGITTNAGVRTDITLTTDDEAGAQMQTVLFRLWDYGNDSISPNSMEDVRIIRALPKAYLCVGIDIVVQVTVGGRAA